jgi:hypothetical protein
MLLSHHQNAGQNHNINIDDRSFENVAQIKHLGTTVTNQNLIQKEIKWRLHLGNACCHVVQNLLSSRLLSKDVEIRIYKTIILRVILYGCETWSLTLWEEHRMRVLENRVLRRIFDVNSNSTAYFRAAILGTSLTGIYCSTPDIDFMFNRVRYHITEMTPICFIIEIKREHKHASNQKLSHATS